MYYYIFDIKRCKNKTLVTDIKSYLSSLGISGEFTYPSAAYTTEELVDLGISKKYNTIVGIGSDDLANSIASRLCGRQEAMGMIPLEASNELASLIGAKTWREGAENLRYRKITNMKIGKSANGGGFLTDLELALKGPTEVTIEFRDYMVQAKVTKLVISNFNPDITKIGPDFLDVVFESVAPEQNVISRIGNFLGFGKDGQKSSFSLFRGRSLRLFTSSQIPLASKGHAIAKTPQLIESSDEDLRLIIGKKSVILE